MSGLDVVLEAPTGVLAALSAHPVCARVFVEDHWGERDVRISVTPASGAEPLVELLCPDENGGAGSWDAVLVHGERRDLWRGPDISCPAETVAGFVVDLLSTDGAALQRRYLLVG